MKNQRLLLLAIATILFVSCGNEEKRINKLIADASKSMLYYPESYDPVSLKIDSLFTDIITDKNIKKANRLVSITNQVESLQRKIEYSEEQVDFWKSGYYDSDMVRKYSREVDSNTQKKDDLVEEGRQIYSELKEVVNAERSFRGFVVEHRFRAKNNNGNVLMSDMLYILNKEKTEVICGYDETDVEFQNFLQVINEIKESEE